MKLVSIIEDDCYNRMRKYIKNCFNKDEFSKEEKLLEIVERYI